MTTYIVVQPYAIDGVDQPSFSTSVETASYEDAQAIAWQRFLAHVGQPSAPQAEGRAQNDGRIVVASDEETA